MASYFLFFLKKFPQKILKLLRSHKTYCKNHANRKIGVFEQISPFSEIKKND